MSSRFRILPWQNGDASRQKYAQLSLTTLHTITCGLPNSWYWSRYSSMVGLNSWKKKSL